MIWSVSTLLRRNGTPTPVCWVNFSMSFSLCSLVVSSRRVGQVGRAGQRAAHGGGGRDQRTDQVGATAFALPPFEIAVRGRRAALAGRQLVGVHAEAH